MRKFVAGILLLAAVWTLTSCSALMDSLFSAGGKQASSSASASEGTETTDPAKPSVEGFLANEPTASEVASFLKANLTSLSPQEGDALLERLILLQLDISTVMDLKIWETPYSNALYDVMGGVLNDDKIGDIEQSDVRSRFQAVSDAMLTIVRYEETPVFEPDWQAIAALKDAFSPEAAAMVDFQARLQTGGIAYTTDMLAADIVAVEKELKGNASGFVRWQLRSVYGRMTARLLFGAEGISIDDFVAGKQDIITSYQKYLDLYGDTRFGTIIKHLLDMQGSDAQSVTDYLLDALTFPPDTTKYAETVTLDENGAQVELLTVRGGEDSAVTDAINTSIKEAALAMLHKGKKEQKVTCFATVSGNYLGVTLSYSNTDTGSASNYTDKNLVYDLGTGKSVTLDNLTGKPFDDYKDRLLGAMVGERIPLDIAGPVDITLADDCIIVLVPSQDGAWPSYYTVTFNGLRRIMDVTTLY